MNKKGVSQLKLPIYFIDAFTENVFQGNPAAVVIVKENLTVASMQSIASENNLFGNCIFEYNRFSVLNSMVYSNC